MSATLPRRKLHISNVVKDKVSSLFATHLPTYYFALRAWNPPRSVVGRIVLGYLAGLCASYRKDKAQQTIGEQATSKSAITRFTIHKAPSNTIVTMAGP
jgi:hypothetical protein